MCLCTKHLATFLFILQHTEPKRKPQQPPRKSKRFWAEILFWEEILFSISWWRWCPPGAGMEVVWRWYKGQPRPHAKQASIFGHGLGRGQLLAMFLSFALSWLLVSAKLFCLSLPCPTMDGNQDALVVQSFTLEFCSCAKPIPFWSLLDFSPEFERLF